MAIFVNLNIFLGVLCFFAAFHTSHSLAFSRKKRQSQQLIPVEQTIVQEIDKEARKHLLFLITERLNETVSTHSHVVKTCETKINSTIKACKECQSASCQQEPVLSDSVFDKIAVELNGPITYAGEVYQDIAKWSSGAKDFLGDKWEVFTTKVGTYLNTVKDELSKGPDHVFKSAVDAVKSLGNKIEDTGIVVITKLGDVVDDARAKIGNPFSDFDQSVTSIGNAITSSASRVKDTVSSAISSMWGSTFGKLVRRKRCAACPACSSVDLQTKSVDQVSNEVCGPTTSDKRKRIMEEITLLKEMYNTSTTGVQIERIEYSSTTSQGSNVPTTIGFFTVKGNNRQFSLGAFDIASTAETGKNMAEQYFTDIINARQVKHVVV